MNIKNKQARMLQPFCHQSEAVLHGQGIVIRNESLAENTWKITIETETELPPVCAGQFVMLRLPNRTDPLLGRPFAIYRVETHRIEIVYLTVGKMTRRLAAVQPKEMIELWLPLGNGFTGFSSVQHTILVAGGIGQTPFWLFCQNRQERVTLLYGVKTAARIACIDDFRELGIEPLLASEDGSAGEPGHVTSLIEKVYERGESTRLLCCGPQTMLRTAFSIAEKYGLPCSVSLETPMGCGLGICFGCVVPYRENENSDWDYKRTCVDGPVFDAYKLRWD